MREPSHARILVVEDQALIALELAERLTAQGYDVVGIVGSGEEALARARETRPDLLVLDIRLRGALDGIEVARVARDELGTPAVFVSAFADDELLRRVREVEPLGYLLKPFDERVLVTTIETALHRWRADAARRRADEATHEAEARLAAVLDATPDAVLALDGAGRVVVFNRAAEQVFGYAAAEILGRPLDRLLPAGLAAEHGAMVERFRNGGDERRAMASARAIHGRRADGTIFPIEATISRLRWHGETFAIAVARDVSAIRRIEHHLVEAQKLEVAALLGAAVAHDFNSILSVIAFSVELAQTSLPPGPWSAELASIAPAVARGGALTRQLVNWTRRQPAHPTRMAIDDELLDLERLLGSLVGHRRALLLDPAAPGAIVEVDRGHLEQILINLVANARDATPAGGRILIRTTASPAHEGVVRIVVEDTGPGVPDELRERVFEPFFTTKEEGRGTGLGLATVRALVRGAGGTVQVSRGAEGGAAFEVLLPLVGFSSEARTRLEQEPPRGGMETMLLVEDEPVLRRLMARVFEEAGYDVHATGGASDTLALLETRALSAAVLIVDLLLPELDGVALAERLCARMPGLRVVWLVDMPEPALLRRASALPDSVVLTKPFEPARLLTTVRALLDGGATPRLDPG